MKRHETEEKRNETVKYKAFKKKHLPFCIDRNDLHKMEGVCTTLRNDHNQSW